MNTIQIGSKLPHDLVARIEDTKYIIKGALSNKKKVNPLNFMFPSKTIGITTIPVDFWEAWVKKMDGFPPLANGLIFAQENKKELKAEAKDKSSLKTGLERVSPEKSKASKDDDGAEV